MKGLHGFIIFVLGAAVGGTGAWYLTKTKYEKMNAADLEAYKQEMREKSGSVEAVEEGEENEANSTSQNASVTHQEARRAILDDSDEENIVREQKFVKMANKRSRDRVDYTKIKANEAYDTVDKVTEKAELEAPVEVRDKPYILNDPLEFDYGDYEKISLTFYDGNGVITDDMDTPIDVNELLDGLDIAGAFGMYDDEPDIVFVRDDILKLDYEIVKVLATYESGDFDPED